MTAITSTIEDVPIFSSGHEALRFAYAYNPEQYPMTMMARMMRGVGIGSGRGLYGLDGAAIAGSVKRVVEALPHPQRDTLICRYAIDEAVFGTAVCALVRPVMASLGSGIFPTRLVAKLICRYYNRPTRQKLADLCDEFGVSAATMTRRWQHVRDRMRAVESEAMIAVDNRLVAVGLVKGEKESLR